MITKEEESKIIKDLSEARKKKVEPLVSNILIDMFQRELPVHDCGYIDSRTREIVDKMMDKMDFSDKEITNARNNLLKVLLKKAKDNLPKPEEFRKKKSDKTEQRNARCEPVVYAIIEDLLKDDLILSDAEFLDLAITDQNRVLFTLSLYGYLEQIFDLLEMSINTHSHDANIILWGGKEKEEVTLNQIQRIKDSKKLAQDKK